MVPSCIIIAFSPGKFSRRLPDDRVAIVGCTITTFDAATLLEFFHEQSSPNEVKMYTERDPLLPSYEQAIGKEQRRRSRRCSHQVWPLVLFSSIVLFVIVLLSVFSNVFSTIYKPKPEPKPKPIPYHVAIVGKSSKTGGM